MRDRRIVLLRTSRVANRGVRLFRRSGGAGHAALARQPYHVRPPVSLASLASGSFVRVHFRKFSSGSPRCNRRSGERFRNGTFALGFSHRTYHGRPNQKPLQILLWWGMHLNTQLTATQIHRGAHDCTLPARGGDPICGMSRSWWYGAGAAGFITLTRVRLPGKKHGRVLLPVAQALAGVEKLRLRA